MQIRSATKYVADNLKGYLKVVEVGVRDGNHAEMILTSLNVSRMYLVDNYNAYMDGGRFITNEEQFNYYIEMQRKLDRYNNITTNVVINSPEAANLFEDESLDYVYIDACHEYDNVKADIEAWYNKIKVGGVLAGHDYTTGWPGVKIAVDEFTNSNNYKLIEPGESDWLIIKT